ncbi:PREDICTED: uncharacterized protein LOC108776781 [Cyphomyrmex costatus]|uniref:Uncharacterized protein n=1 Tax=Cyphomyrmex costatus TaxID=456900 RepID=A0A151IEX5_9HYME|nr:PREDICTED: uncharacterized protein LOC108776781 [Cyphomyrmex costatus]KYM99361.1 hypothetical protein ALC62_09863 [Cyphomyrmex costatus]
MDCCFANQYESSQIRETISNVSSPEMFDSDTESDIYNKNVETQVTDNNTLAVISPQMPTQAELIAKSDNYMLVRINKFLSGVPPPPRHTTCQSDCSDFLRHIYENRRLFYIGCPLPNESSEIAESTKLQQQKRPTETNDKNVSYQCTKGTPRNLTNAFNLTADSIENTQLNINNSGSHNLNIQCDVSKEIKNPVNMIKETIEVVPVADKSDVSHEHSPVLYHTISEEGAKALAWPQAYYHKFHGIHYNRSRTVEEFENSTVKLCERYIGAETQSSCNIWFSKPPGSIRKRSLLMKRRNGQSPEKRLTHLTKRRRTFCSANLKGLGLADKRQLMIPIKKLTHKKGKSPRGKSLHGKSPRGRSPRGKSPISSAKKKVVRRLMLDESSPCKSKLETSKRALFQSPPSDHAGPSKLLGTNNIDTQKIKRVLFSTSKKNESVDAKQTSSREESRKRKCDEELQGPRLKWAKSLSFDCMHEIKNTSKVIWDRHSSSSILSKNETSVNEGKNELSDTHRKKLLWAVAEALRSKGIGMSHPKFKQYAANLARTIKKFMPDLENRNIPRKPGSTSDRMLKLAKHHVLFLMDTRPIN